MILGGGIELAAYLLAFVVLGGFGRRVPLCVYLSLSGVICILMVVIRNFLSLEVTNVPAVVTALALIGKAAVVSCFCIIFLYSSEVIIIFIIIIIVIIVIIVSGLSHRDPHSRRGLLHLVWSPGLAAGAPGAAAGGAPPP